jgi:hypothetical protein
MKSAGLTRAGNEIRMSAERGQRGIATPVEARRPSPDPISNLKAIFELYDIMFSSPIKRKKEKLKSY